MPKPERLHIGPDMIPKMTTPRPDDDLATVAFLQIELRRNGAMSITGNVGEPLLAQQMLTEAMEALKRQHAGRQELVIPGHDSNVSKLAGIR